MSVSSAVRGRGVAKALFAAVHRFVEQTDGLERIVLSTSTLQKDAHDRLYPRLGFRAECRKRVFGKVEATFFALDLSKNAEAM